MNKKLAVVTGANKGIGKEIVRQLAEKGMHVILTSRNFDRGTLALRDLDNESIRYHQLDVTSQNSIAGLHDYIKREFGSLDVLVNNAGINYDTWHTALGADLDNVRETFETNFFGAWQTIQILLPMLTKSKSARVINVSSGAGALNDMGAGTPGYSASKAALNVLTIKMAAELIKNKISINSVCPGWVRTEMGGATAPRSVEEGAETIVWLATEADHSLTGKFFRDKQEISW